jgi:hypothetical protein
MSATARKRFPHAPPSIDLPAAFALVEPGGRFKIVRLAVANDAWTDAVFTVSGDRLLVVLGVGKLWG